MKKNLSIENGIWLLFLAALFVVGGCREDGAPEPETVVHILAGTTSYEDIDKLSTRSLPDGFSEYSPADGTKLYLCFQSSEFSLCRAGSFVYNESLDHWQSFLSVTSAIPYEVFGFMPSDLGTYSISPCDGDYANGAILTFSGLSPALTSDPCIVTGVLRGTSSTIPIEDSGIVEGQFGYMAELSDNYIYLLMDHLYCGLDFRFRLDATYSRLRQIRLKEVYLKTDQTASVHARITLKANNTGTSPIESIVWTPQNGSHEQCVYSNDEGQILTTSYEALLGARFSPIFSDNVHMSLVCIYDVYTADGQNLIREDCRAENLLPQVEGMERGQKRTMRVSIDPTYLYVLADPDLDNPTFTIE
ncbi:MAG: hypothetical protein K6C30_05635 [Bacteroidaceae bacterium]|nr:hypothetical protein [Bacteroidaceae bacterium]